MRKILLFVFVCSFSMMNAQTKRDTTFTDSVLISITDQLNDINYRIHGLDRYKLYKTENVYTFLKLDTKTGKIE